MSWPEFSGCFDGGDCRLIKDRVATLQGRDDNGQAQLVVVEGHKVDSQFDDIRQLAQVPAKLKCLAIMRADLLDVAYLGKLIDKIRQYSEESGTPLVRVG